MVQSSKCQGVLGPRDRSCCKACFALVKWDKFRAYIAKKGYMLDLLKLVWKSFMQRLLSCASFGQLCPIGTTHRPAWPGMMSWPS